MLRAISYVLDVYKRQFFSSAITTLKTLVVAIGAGLGVWGVVNLLEGYGNDNRATRSQVKSLRTKSKGNCSPKLWRTDIPMGEMRG